MKIYKAETPIIVTEQEEKQLNKDLHNILYAAFTSLGHMPIKFSKLELDMSDPSNITLKVGIE